MGKGSVWNKGKHNGGGLSGKRIPKESSQPQADQPAAEEQTYFNEKLNTVKRMNRENWVQRPVKGRITEGNHQKASDNDR